MALVKVHHDSNQITLPDYGGEEEKDISVYINF